VTDREEIDRLRKRIAQLERMNVAMMDRIERTVDTAGSAYAMFESHIVMQQTIRERTRELAQANESLREEISERRRAEEQMRLARDQAEAASVAKSQFLANMSHEIRTPMTAILGYADLLDTDKELARDPARVADAVHAIRGNANHLMVIINDILDMSKIEAGRMTVERIDTSPAQIIEDVAALIQPRAKDKGIAVEVHYDSPIPERIQSDPTRLRQILLNLTGNAIKFTEVGSVSIHADCEPGRRIMSFRVRDTGVGMTVEQRDLIARFDAFSQADTSTTRRFGGTGLGLRISNSLALLLGGRIEVESEAGRGSTFTVRIATGDLGGVPMVDPESGAFSGEPRSGRLDHGVEPTRRPRVLDGLRILLVEDGRDNQRLISYHLEKAGAQVEVAKNGRVAVERLLGPGVAPDLVLMDMQMPELDGYGATRRLRAAGSSLPVIALTAHAMAGDREKCLEAGCDDYLTKPIDRAKLIEACRVWGDVGVRRRAA